MMQASKIVTTTYLKAQTRPANGTKCKGFPASLATKEKDITKGIVTTPYRKGN